MILLVGPEVQRHSNGIGSLMTQFLCIAVNCVTVQSRDGDDVIFRILLDERTIAQGSRYRWLRHPSQLRDIVHRNRLFHNHVVLYSCRRRRIPQFRRAIRADFEVIREVLLPAPISWLNLSYSSELYAFMKSISKRLKCISFGCKFNSQQGSFGGDV